MNMYKTALSKREQRVQDELFRKLPKKEQRRLNAAQRGTWGSLNPVTRVKGNGKAYSRAKAKAEARAYA